MTEISSFSPIVLLVTVPTLGKVCLLIARELEAGENFELPEDRANS